MKKNILKYGLVEGSRKVRRIATFKVMDIFHRLNMSCNHNSVQKYMTKYIIKWKMRKEQKVKYFTEECHAQQYEWQVTCLASKRQKGVIQEK